MKLLTKCCLICSSWRNRSIGWITFCTASCDCVWCLTTFSTSMVCKYTSFHFLITITLRSRRCNISTCSSWTCCSAICTFTNFCMIILRKYGTICCCTRISYSICTSSLWSILTSCCARVGFTIISSIIWNTGTEDRFFCICICCWPFISVSSTYWSTCSLWITFWTIIITSWFLCITICLTCWTRNGCTCYSCRSWTSCSTSTRCINTWCINSRGCTYFS